MEPVFLVYRVRPAEDPRTSNMMPHCSAVCPPSSLLLCGVDAAAGAGAGAGVDDEEVVESGMMEKVRCFVLVVGGRLSSTLIVLVHTATGFLFCVAPFDRIGSTETCRYESSLPLEMTSVMVVLTACRIQRRCEPPFETLTSQR